MMTETAQASADAGQETHHPGRWPKGVSGNPSGVTVSRRFQELHTALVAEFGDVLTASDKALLEQAARLLARRWRDETCAIRASSGARRIIMALHERHRRKRAYRRDETTPDGSWSPLRSSMSEASE
jgi:hypothetical protein